MVSFKLYGGSRLGNYCSQIAATYAYARKHNMGYLVPRDNYKYHEVLTKVNYGVIENEADYFQYKEPTHAYKEIPYHPQILLDGYFQCFKYCEDYRADILDLFGFEYKMNKGVVAIHVRRGDYVKWQNSFPLCTAGYYMQAITAFKDSGYKEFLVFGEDAETYNWFKHNVKVEGVNFTYQPIGTAFGDLQRMASCEHNIIANSTYSVWGAWANQNPDKIVIAPNKLTNWYGAIQKIDTKDVYPDDWIGISFKPAIG